MRGGGRGGGKVEPRGAERARRVLCVCEGRPFFFVAGRHAGLAWGCPRSYAKGASTTTHGLPGT
jgi:hypothetical protein